MKFPRFLLPLLLIAVVAGGGRLVEQTRSRQRSVLSGVFESQPTLVASRIGGRIRAISCPEGSTVEGGRLLLELEVGPAESEARALEQKAREANAVYALVKAGPRVEDIRRQQAVVEETRAQLERLRNGPRPAEVGAARARYHQAEAVYQRVRNGQRREDIEKLRAVLDQMRERSRLAQVERRRHQALFREGALSRQTLDRVESEAVVAASAQVGAEQALLEAVRGNRPEDLAAARAEMEGARQQLLVLEEGSRSEDLLSAEARLAQMEASLDALHKGSRPQEVEKARAAAEAAQLSARSARQNVSECLVRAPKSGVVERVLVAVGDLIQPQTPLVRISDPDDLWLRVYLPQDMLPRVKVGDTADVVVDGMAQVVPCRIDSIATQGEFTPANLQTPEERGKQVFAIRLRLVTPDRLVKAGMSATVKRMGNWP